MSLPWILTEYVLQTPPLIEHALVPFAIYDDAARRALDQYKQRFLCVVFCWFLICCLFLACSFAPVNQLMRSLVVCLTAVLCRYDEIASAVNLCFEQLVYRLTELVYAHYKERASLYVPLYRLPSLFIVLSLPVSHIIVYLSIACCWTKHTKSRRTDGQADCTYRSLRHSVAPASRTGIMPSAQ